MVLEERRKMRLLCNIQAFKGTEKVDTRNTRGYRKRLRDQTTEVSEDFTFHIDAQVFGMD